MIPARLDLVEDVLDGCSSDRRQLFELRVERRWPDLVEGLEAVYPPEQAAALAARLLRAAATTHRDRPDDLARLDIARELRPDWFQSPEQVGYAAYAERFAPSTESDAEGSTGGAPTTGLDGVRQRIPYLRELGVTYLHLMPLLLPREGDADGGYAVADYRQVRPDLGTTEDLAALAAELRAHGISLVLDLVLNHVAREHPWAVAARAGEQRYRDYFHVFDDRALPDAYEATLPEVFPDSAPGSFTFEPELGEAGAWVWTTFNSFQWDVDWANPDVFAEYADVVLFLAGLGADVLRLDAIAFLWKRLGTNSQNQPEVHALTRALRALVRICAPATAFKAEAIVGPADLVAYLGTGTHHGKVSDLAYHNSLMVAVWSMLAARDVRLAVRALRALPPVPTSVAWVTYVRGHDDIGWAVDDADAAAVGLDGGAHRRFLSDWYSGHVPGSWARGLVFQENAATGDRRISGTAADLAGLAAGDPHAVPRLLLAHAVVYGWGGIPVLWSGDELGLLGDPGWASEPGHEDDNRWAHRPRITERALAARRAPSGPASEMFAGLRHLGAVRASLPHLHASVASEALEPSDPGVLAVVRRHPVGTFLGLYNVTDTWRPFPGARLDALGLRDGVDALAGGPPPWGGDGQLWLPPLRACWLVDAAPTRPPTPRDSVRAHGEEGV